MSNTILALIQNRPGSITPDPDTGMGGGSGTIEDPYLIATPEQLHNLRNFPSAYFKQVRHLNLAPHILEDFSWYDPIGGWQPFGPVWGDPFNGYFDGNGYTIQNMFINRPSVAHQGFFTGLGPTASIHNLKILNATVTGGQKAGLLAGYINGSTVDDIVLSGSVTGNGRTGGITGESTGASALISDIVFTGTVTGLGWLTGGAVGFNSGNWQNCTVQAVVECSGGGGGFAGENTGSLIRCSKYGSLLTSGGNVGGFASINSGDIYQCRVVGDLIAGAGNLGGFSNTNSGNIRESIAIGNVSGAGWNIGGFINTNTGLLENSYALVNISSTTSGYAILVVSNRGTTRYCFSAGTRTGGNPNQTSGGIYENNAGIRCYHDSTLSQDFRLNRTIPKTTKELKAGAIPDLDIFVDWSSEIWNTVDIATYPKLQWELEGV
ncbi:MAG: hypothetical protein WCY49_07055 [Anaerovoracaceae bacterium]